MERAGLLPRRQAVQPARQPAGLGRRFLSRRLAAGALLLALIVAAGSAPATSGAANLERAEKHWRFPVAGPHDFGNLVDTGFGALRSDGSLHTGQDILADCGTPLRAVHDSKVLSRGHSTGYGFYIVLDGLGSGLDFTYGHLKQARLPRRGKQLHRGQRIGFVGDTGTEAECHLHFEVWHGHWLKGDRVDPLPRLQLWDRFS